MKLDEAGFFRFRPREMRLDAFYGGQADPQNPWGFVWTDWGQMLMVAGNNGGIYYPLPEMIRGVQGGRRENIWVNARGRKSSGPDIVGTAHLPPEWQGVMLSGGYINNAVWALKVEDDGAGFKVTDLPPLITARTDTSFRPVDVKIGPDGAIYLCDWFNPIIGHYQASFRHPDRDKTHGRIWRITVQRPPAGQAAAHRRGAAGGVVRESQEPRALGARAEQAGAGGKGDGGGGEGAAGVVADGRPRRVGQRSALERRLPKQCRCVRSSEPEHALWKCSASSRRMVRRRALLLRLLAESPTLRAYAVGRIRAMERHDARTSALSSQHILRTMTIRACGLLRIVAAANDGSRNVLS